MCLHNPKHSGFQAEFSFSFAFFFFFSGFPCLLSWLTWLQDPEDGVTGDTRAWVDSETH